MASSRLQPGALAPLPYLPGTTACHVPLVTLAVPAIVTSALTTTPRLRAVAGVSWRSREPVVSRVSVGAVQASGVIGLMPLVSRVSVSRE